jgi:hypothetical protein
MFAFRRIVSKPNINIRRKLCKINISDKEETLFMTFNDVIGVLSVNKYHNKLIKGCVFVGALGGSLKGCDMCYQLLDEALMSRKDPLKFMGFLIFGPTFLASLTLFGGVFGFMATTFFSFLVPACIVGYGIDKYKEYKK